MSLMWPRGENEFDTPVLRKHRGAWPYFYVFKFDFYCCDMSGLYVDTKLQLFWMHHQPKLVKILSLCNQPIVFTMLTLLYCRALPLTHLHKTKKGKFLNWPLSFSLIHSEHQRWMQNVYLLPNILKILISVLIKIYIVITSSGNHIIMADHQ